MIAIDLGSNTIRFLASDGTKIVYDRQFVVRTAENLAQSKVISQRALDRIKNAILTAQNDFDFSHHTIKAVATEAFRQATNAQNAVEFLHKNTGIKFQVITPETEARLTANAIRSSAKKHNLLDPMFIVDIGGASSEVIYLNNQEFDYVSLPIGIVKVAEKALDKLDLIAYLQDELKPLEQFKKPANLLIATAGTPTTLAAIKIGQNYLTYRKEDINGVTLDLNEIEKLYQQLLATNQSDLITLLGENRADLVIAGSIMLQEFIRSLGFERCTVFDEGLREGVLDELIN